MKECCKQEVKEFLRKQIKVHHEAEKKVEKLMNEYEIKDKDLEV